MFSIRRHRGQVFILLDFQVMGFYEIVLYENH